jgi:hypothetical protein
MTFFWSGDMSETDGKATEFFVGADEHPIISTTSAELSIAENMVRNEFISV